MGVHGPVESACSLPRTTPVGTRRAVAAPMRHGGRHRAPRTTRAARATGRSPSVATFADGVATRSPDPEALAGVLAGAADIVSVTDDEMAEAIRLLFRSTHHLSCGAGAAALAALVAQRDRWHGRKVAAIHTSSNIDTPLAATVLAGHTPPSGGR
ncbi:MAG: pyridoxal-phosphate dependent enzyme [Microthrixaceae bacterium]